MATVAALPVQSFAANALDRSIAERRDADFVQTISQAAQYVLVAGSRISVDQGQDQAQLRWFSAAELEKLGLEALDGVLKADSASVAPVLLGRESQETWRLAADVSCVAEPLQQKGVVMEELRALLPRLPADQLAVGGHAVALSQWHAAHAFCGRCGALTEPIQAGGKRRCTADPRHREYPRTDPVAIMLVESMDGSRALLGRPRNLRPGVLTCLSGFIEQGETIEEAVRREVLEEAGIPVGSVHILGSQPWPIGRGGTCELMIGAVGKALDDALHQDFEEMEDVRWVSKDDVLRAIRASSATSNATSYGTFADGLDFYIPPQWAIAHHLIKVWASNKSGSWFSKI